MPSSTAELPGKARLTFFTLRPIPHMSPILHTNGPHFLHKTLLVLEDFFPFWDLFHNLRIWGAPRRISLFSCLGVLAYTLCRPRPRALHMGAGVFFDCLQLSSTTIPLGLF